MKTETEDLAHENYPYGSTAEIGSRDKALYEEKKKSFIAGYLASQDKWISVELAKEKLNEHQIILCWFPENNMASICVYKNGGFKECTGRMFGECTHFQLLPPPPKTK
ncbi:MAG: hypothetical protein V4549_07770 [Bacteroidota bacterium]